MFAAKPVMQSLSVLALLLTSALSSPFTSSPSLAGYVGKQCLSGARYAGSSKGKNITIAGVPTYLAEPSPSQGHGSPKKVLLFYSDVFGPFYINNQLQEDYFASQGFHVLGIDYFLGDPIGNHVSFDLVPFDPSFNLTAWVEKSRVQTRRILPNWIDAVIERYGKYNQSRRPDARYTAVGYCYGALYSVEISATDKVVAGAFAHPAELTEDHFKDLTKPLLLSCAETDSTFPAQNLNRAIEILTEEKANYHVQIFAGTVHGFSTRADPKDVNAWWAKEESAKSVVNWFNRFSK